MIPILEYITQVHERAQRINPLRCTPHMDLVEDFMYVMKSKNLTFKSDEEVLEHLDGVARDRAVRQALSDFKRNYKAWKRRHK